MMFCFGCEYHNSVGEAARSSELAADLFAPGKTPDIFPEFYSFPPEVCDDNKLIDSFDNTVRNFV